MEATMYGTPSNEPVFRIIYPENRNVSAKQIMMWASDAVDNGESSSSKPTTLAEAIAILEDSGHVTFHKSIDAFLNTPMAYEVWE